MPCPLPVILLGQPSSPERTPFIGRRGHPSTWKCYSLSLPMKYPGGKFWRFCHSSLLQQIWLSSRTTYGKPVLLVCPSLERHHQGLVDSENGFWGLCLRPVGSMSRKRFNKRSGDLWRGPRIGPYTTPQMGYRACFTFTEKEQILFTIHPILFLPILDLSGFSKHIWYSSATWRLFRDLCPCFCRVDGWLLWDVTDGFQYSAVVWAIHYTQSVLLWCLTKWWRFFRVRNFWCSLTWMNASWCPPVIPL